MMRKIHKKIAAGIFSAGLVVGSFAFTKMPNRHSGKTHGVFRKVASDTTSGAPDNLSELPSPHPQLSQNLYRLALRGYLKLKAAHRLSSPLLSIVDFSLPSSQKRLFIIDMDQQKVLLHTLVAHGRNSGENMASRFSNMDASHQSSLGFYITGGTYLGSNGYSLKLKGLEPGFNDKAESRAIVLHGAPYVSEQVVKSTGRLGRSWGCPAVSQQEHKKIIDLIKGGSCLFIYAPQQAYLSASALLKDSATRSGSL